MYALQFAHACDWKKIQAYHVIKNTYSNVTTSLKMSAALPGEDYLVICTTT